MPANRSVEAEVCVIGAGIMGLSASWELTKRGISTLCLDRGKPGAEASGSNAGTLAIQNKRLESIHLALQAVRRWKTLSAELESNLEYEQRGGYRVAHKSDQVRALESAVRAQQKLGVQVEMVYPPQLFKRAPFLSREILAASYCGDDGMANPFLATRAYVAACRRAGVAFEFGHTSRVDPPETRRVLFGAGSRARRSVPRRGCRRRSLDSASMPPPWHRASSLHQDTAGDDYDAGAASFPHHRDAHRGEAHGESSSRRLGRYSSGAGGSARDRRPTTGYAEKASPETWLSRFASSRRWRARVS